MSFPILLGVTTPTKQVSIWMKLAAKIDWQQILINFGGKILEIIFFCVLFWIIDRLGKRLLHHIFVTNANTSLTASNRVSTIFTLALNIFHYTVMFFGIYAVLSVLGVPVGTLIASAGIFSVALGLGAQGFVSDIVTGFFILLEDQIDVGDYVTIDTVEGTVSAIGLRTTQVTSPDGSLNFIPNRKIMVISNKSRNDMRVLIDLVITTSTPIDQLTTAVKQANRTLIPQYPDIIGDPDIQGVTTQPDGTLVFRVQFYVKNGMQATIQRDFLAAYLTAAKQAGITLPSPTLNFHSPK
ncbi:mechanosensitive ion channel family protein [Lactiplantibacillus mudanjiangensis]|uniref:Mechanosensitive ion channel protein MscS [Lactobacillus sp.] n=1 Tax=Lactiplantibacillus mudanjiangensis TaxID=1296538 RepID=A0A660EBS0_9LACO|nr:mechanosensitive ion channel family protein [Lactiplantibacillus mudanjiangensis]VDG19233.1 mechanosensitive ion channel protein MscS [Lactobacillus sp.] [Lactiplantibacillus mudanjiangensis]VDG25606.1 mechanosensitive ion channel protein MscS [Lactobacillus sp.] [Lactiplantibacillus mudanjiangensis]VDG29996.1 mechanosensitive ion channel protein MscS [Lactobacillus sp.] [Lactiplantibacillus mudanjiangensis]VDG33305.1 mechanosensitive ion channel protein MscS [Lactobacillus sp.] [Lactiplanti